MTSGLAPGALRELAAAQLPHPRDVMGDVPRTISRIFSIGGSTVVLVGMLVGVPAAAVRRAAWRCSRSAW